MKRIALAALAVVVTACGLEPLSVWRVSAVPTSKPASCYREGQAPDGSTTYDKIQADLGVWEIYEGTENKFYLTGVASIGGESTYSSSAVLEGTYSSGTYTFEGSITSVDPDRRENPTMTLTYKSVQKVEMTMDGDAFTGKISETETYKCEGSSCDPNFGKNYPDCTVSTSIFGSKVDTDNLHVVGND